MMAKPIQIIAIPVKCLISNLSFKNKTPRTIALTGIKKVTRLMFTAPAVAKSL